MYVLFATCVQEKVISTFPQSHSRTRAVVTLQQNQGNSRPKETTQEFLEHGYIRILKLCLFFQTFMKHICLHLLTAQAIISRTHRESSKLTNILFAVFKSSCDYVSLTSQIALLLNNNNVEFTCFYLVSFVIRVPYYPKLASVALLFFISRLGCCKFLSISFNPQLLCVAYKKLWNLPNRIMVI